MIIAIVRFRLRAFAQPLNETSQACNGPAMHALRHIHRQQTRQHLAAFVRAFGLRGQ